MKIVVTMAGEGSRFKEAGFKVEKHEIVFHGRTLFEWAVGSLKNFYDYEFIFISRDFISIEDFIRKKTKDMGIKKVQLKIIKNITRGQAETALLAEEFFEDDDSLIIYNIDTHINPDYLKPNIIRGDGWLPVFYAKGTKWSFVQADDNNLVSRTTEKIRISDNCSVGLYYFSSLSVFKNSINLYYKNPENTFSDLTEWYIAPLYNILIANGSKTYMYKLPTESVIVLGTPEDLISAEGRFANGDNSNNK
jgi:dTDP-glucose pyrophosphorylase